MSDQTKLPDIVTEMLEQARLGRLVGQDASPTLLEKGAAEITRLRPSPGWHEAIEALRWLTHVVNGIGKGGGRPTSEEEAGSNKAAQDVLNAYDRSLLPPGGEGLKK